MCESRASIWWRTVRRTQCSSYEGMRREIQMPSRYFTNFKEKFYHPTPHDFLSIVSTYLFENFWPQCFHWPVHQALLRRLVAFNVTRETYEGVGKE